MQIFLIYDAKLSIWKQLWCYMGQTLVEDRTKNCLGGDRSKFWVVTAKIRGGDKKFLGGDNPSLFRTFSPMPLAAGVCNFCVLSIT